MHPQKLQVKWDWGLGLPYQFTHDEVQMLYQGGGDTWLREKFERQTGRKLPLPRRGFQKAQPKISKTDLESRPQST